MKMNSLALFLLGGAAAQQNCRCLPGDPCWPHPDVWQQLNASVNGRLEVPNKPPLKAACAGGSAAQCISEVTDYMDNDWVPPTYSASTEATGMALNVGGWQNLPSAYVVAVETVEDISHAVAFASEHNLRLVVKGAGHDYLGRSTAPNSLLVWTHRMDQIQWAEDELSVTVGAGVHWEDVYNQAQTRGRFVLGGGCPTVGAAGGFTMGAGFNEFFSRTHGTAAHNLLSATVILADGSVVEADANQNTDLFWALRGGGGGTFGVVASMTFKTHDWPATFGYMSGTVKCKGADASTKRSMLAEFLSFAEKHLLTQHWGSAANWNTAGELSMTLGYHGIAYEQALALWNPFNRAVHKLGCQWHWDPFDDVYPAPFVFWTQRVLVKGKMIAKLYPTPSGQYIKDDPKGRWVETATVNEINAYWYGYASRYITMDLFKQPELLAEKLDTLVNTAGSPGTYQLFFGKALGGKVGSEIKHDISANPAVYEAGVLLLTANSIQNIMPDLPKSWEMLQVFPSGTIEDLKLRGVPASCFTETPFAEKEVAKCWDAVTGIVDGEAKMFNTVYTGKLRELFGNSGAYHNEGDYFEPDWQNTFWGENYPRLKSIKDAQDPKGLFVCHHCVGSEEWSPDGNCRIAPSPTPTPAFDNVV